MIFKDIESATIYMTQNLPPFGRKWTCAKTGDGSKVSLMLTERCVIDPENPILIDPSEVKPTKKLPRSTK